MLLASVGLGKRKCIKEVSAIHANKRLVPIITLKAPPPVDYCSELVVLVSMPEFPQA